MRGSSDLKLSDPYKVACRSQSSHFVKDLVISKFFFEQDLGKLHTFIQKVIAVKRIYNDDARKC